MSDISDKIDFCGRHQLITYGTGISLMLNIVQPKKCLSLFHLKGQFGPQKWIFWVRLPIHVVFSYRFWSPLGHKTHF